MSNIGRIVQRNGKDNYECYVAGTNGGFPADIVPNGRVLGMEWATPCSSNGVTVDDFDYTLAKSDASDSATPPRADSFKVLVVEDTCGSCANGSYQKVLVGNAYKVADYLVLACAGCAALPDVTVPAPIIPSGECSLPAPVQNPCVYKTSIYVPALTGANTTYTATPYGVDPTGAKIVFAPATATGTTVTALAAAMQTAWASELGTGTFVATGNVINITSTLGQSVGFSIAQS